jgi:hypothetical protein
MAGLRDKSTTEALIADQGRLYVGALINDSEKFINDRYQKYYNEIISPERTGVSDGERRVAVARTWERIINDAFTDFKTKHHVDHTKTKIAVLDIDPENGKQFYEIDDVDFLPVEDFNSARLIKDPHTHLCWSYAQYIAKMITGPKNIDRKIFVVGDSGDGKSLTALNLAIRISRWVAYYLNCEQVKKNEQATHKPEEFFKMDNDHVGCILGEDLIHVATVELPQYSIKILDDCGAALGFTNRRSMSGENLDLVSIIGTNRVRNGVMIYTVQTETFTDIRMQMLANEKIDLAGYTQSGDKYRLGQLYKIKRDKKRRNKIVECKFAFWSFGKQGKKGQEYCTVEGIICYPPEDQALIDKYNNMRKEKEAENTQAIKNKYAAVQKEMDVSQKIQQHTQICPKCFKSDLRYSKKERLVYCRSCGSIVKNEMGGE